MRKLFEKVRQEAFRFIEQRDDFLMVTSCSDTDAGMVLQILRDIEQASSTDIFLLFADNFVQASPFVSVTVERLREQHQLASEGLREKGREPLPPIPSSLFDSSQQPQARLRQAICFARSLLPRGGGRRLVWAMFPQQIVDRRGYLRLVGSLVPWEGVKAWMAGIRLIFRDEPGTSEYAPGLARAPRVRLSSLDLGPAAIEASTREDVDDEELPEAERMQSLLSLALLDYAHNSTNDAIAKYSYLLGYYQRTENQVMQAFVINALGDVFHRQGDLERAQHWYECAVPPAAAVKDPLILATLSRNLGDVSYKLGRFGEAEQYYDGVDKLSAVTLDPGSKIRALEWRGLSQAQQGKDQSAIQSWEAAALLSRKMNLSPLLRENLKHLMRAYKRVGADDKAISVAAELKNLEQQEAKP